MRRDWRCRPKSCQVLERAPDNASAYFRIGQIHMARNNMKLASLALRSALGNEPEHIGALTALGVLQLIRLLKVLVSWPNRHGLQCGVRVNALIWPQYFTIARVASSFSP